jgi:hypothetical protein
MLLFALFASGLLLSLTRGILLPRIRVAGASYLIAIIAFFPYAGHLYLSSPDDFDYFCHSSAASFRSFRGIMNPMISDCQAKMRDIASSGWQRTFRFGVNRFRPIKGLQDEEEAYDEWDHFQVFATVRYHHKPRKGRNRTGQHVELWRKGT